jgi:hypothetical protein
MLKVLDRDPHTGRLGDLLRRFHAQELSMGRALQEMQAELEYWQREANFLRAGAPGEAERVLRRCSELQNECDLLATEHQDRLLLAAPVAAARARA